jgi:FkbM family methyltransferase
MSQTSAPSLIRSLRRLYSHTVTRQRVLRRAPKEVTFRRGRATIELQVATWATANFVLAASPEGRFDYEPAETELFLGLLPEVRTFLDVGSHVGYYALIAAGDDPARRVVAFEILEDFADEIDRHRRNNRLANLELERAAVGAGGEQVSFQNFADRNTRAAVSLDEYTAARGLAPDLIKLDIEGHEVAGLAGMARLLREARPTLMLAFHPPMIEARDQRPVEALEPLWAAGYTVEEVVPRDRDRTFELRPVEASSVPTDLCMLLCRPRA